MSEEDATLDDFVAEDAGDSDFEEVNELREDRLENFMSIIKGTKPDRVVNEPSDSTEDYLVVDTLTGEERKFTPDTGGPRATVKDTLMIMDGSKSGRVYQGKNGIIGSTMAAIRPNGINSHFLRYFLESKFDRLNSATKGSAVPHTDKDLLRGLDIPVFPADEQRKIASVLYSVDQAIQKTQEIIEQITRVKTAVVQELTMRGVRHTDFEKVDITPKYLDVEFPVSWEKVTYEDVTKNITYGFTNPMPETDSGPWMVTAKDVVDSRINYKSARKTTQEAFSAKLTSKSRPGPGTVLVTKDGTLGRVAVVDKEGICINQSVASLNPIEEKVMPQFLALVIRSPLTKKLIEAYNPQTTIGHIKISELAEWEFGLPPLEEQKEIVSIVSSFREIFFIENDYKNQLEDLKQGLMQDLLSGEFRIHDKDVEVRPEVAEHG